MSLGLTGTSPTAAHVPIDRTAPRWLPLGVKIQLVHQWVYPTLYNAATVVPMPKKVPVQLKKYVQLALNVTSLTVSLVGLSTSMHGEGRKLMPVANFLALVPILVHDVRVLVPLLQVSSQHT